MLVGVEGEGRREPEIICRMLDQALCDFSKAAELPPTPTTVPGEQDALGTCGDTMGCNRGK